MDDASSPCQALAVALASADMPASMLPAVLPCAPLDLLVALHQVVVGAMLSDHARAQRAAEAAWIVASRFPDDSLLQAQAHWSQASAILYVPDYVRSLAHYDAALIWYERACQRIAPATPPRDVRVIQIVRVFCLSELGRYVEAQHAVEQAELWLRDHPDDYARLTLLLNRSQLAGRMGDYARMLELADATIVLATELRATARVAQGTIALAVELGATARAAQGWINRAHACINLGRFVEAEAALEQGSTTASQVGESVTVARALVNRARLLRYQGQLFAALNVLREAEQGLAQAPGEAAILALQEAGIYEQLLQLSDAQRAARYAAGLFAQQMMPVYSADAFLRAARNAIQQRNTTTARDLLKLATAQAEQAHVPQIDAQIALAQAELATLPGRAIAPAALARQRRRARTAAQQAVVLLDASGLVQEAAVGQLTLATLETQLGNPTAALAIYQDLARHTNAAVQIAAHSGLGALLPPSEGLSHLKRAAALAVEQRRALPMEELQARYSSETSPHHMRLAACYLALGDTMRALESVCAAKAGPLLDLRAAAAALDESSLRALQSFKADLSRWRQEAYDQRRWAQFAAQNREDEGAFYHTQRAAAAESQVRTTERALTEAVRTLGDRRGHAQVPDVAAIQAALPRGSVLLEYAQFDDQLVCFLVRTGDTPECRILGDYRTLAPLLDRWSLVCRRLMDERPPADARRQIQAVLAPLWHMLLAPWSDDLAPYTELLIAPYGILHHIPWATLFECGSPSQAPATLTLTPCGALWAAPSDPPEAPPGPPRLLGYAGSGDRRLHHVASELDAIARHLPGAQVRMDATCADLCAAPAPCLLHIAAHGLTNPVVPLCSTIELADGPFLLLEAHRLNLRGTDLVVLSACETSVRPDYGDMALALSGAFLCAGARAVLASLWRVSDATTAALMERFYAALAAGASPAAALRQAQQGIYADHPLDWAAFQLWAAAR